MSQRIEQNSSDGHEHRNPTERLANSNVDHDRAGVAAPLRSSNLSGGGLASEHRANVAGPSIGGTAAPYDSTKLEAAKEHLVESMEGLDMNSTQKDSGLDSTKGKTLTEKTVTEKTVTETPPHDQHQGPQDQEHHSLADTVVSGAVTVAAGAVAAGASVLQTALNWVMPNSEEGKQATTGGTNVKDLPIASKFVTGTSDPIHPHKDDSEQFPSIMGVDNSPAVTSPPSTASAPLKEPQHQKQQEHHHHPVGHDHSVGHDHQDHTKPTKSHVPTAAVLGATSSSAPPVKDKVSSTAEHQPVKDKLSSTAEHVKDKVSSTAEHLKDKVSSPAKDKVSSTAEHQPVKDKVSSTAEHQPVKGKVSSTAEHLKDKVSSPAKDEVSSAAVHPPAKDKVSSTAEIPPVGHDNQYHAQQHMKAHQAPTAAALGATSATSSAPPVNKASSTEIPPRAFGQDKNSSIPAAHHDDHSQRHHQHGPSATRPEHKEHDRKENQDEHEHVSIKEKLSNLFHRHKETEEEKAQASKHGHHHPHIGGDAAKSQSTAATTDPIPGYSDLGAKNKKHESDAATMDTAATRITSLNKDPVEEVIVIKEVTTEHPGASSMRPDVVDPTRVQANERQGRHL